MHSNIFSVQMIAEILAGFGIEHIVISPGSRNAPLSIEFSEDKRFKCYSVVDERSAAFVALGMAKSLQKPTVLCCTSGSALANYYPAWTEAFYANIPLVVISADRPQDLIDQFDGQTIRQNKLFEKHSIGNFQLREEDTNEALTDNFMIIKKAISECILNQTPIHLNVPLKEPLYELTEEKLIDIETLKMPIKTYQEPDFQGLAGKWNLSEKKMILCGSLEKNYERQLLLNQISEIDKSVIVLTESTSNLYNPSFFNSIDLLVFNFNSAFIEQYQPDLLLTIGQNVVSKKIKDFLRQSNICEHFHVDEFWQPNTYQALTETITYPNIDFLQAFIPLIKPIHSGYFNQWNKLRQESLQISNHYFKKIGFSDLKVFGILSEQLLSNSILHFSNSSPIRYSQLFDFNKEKSVYCNRGVSGIDGCTSTAVGFSMVSNQKNILITGDISFFYDINGLWNNYIPKNFKIILINNGGGNIFKIIPGPEKTAALETYLETKHQKNAKLLAENFGFKYDYVDNQLDMEKKLPIFLNTSNQPHLLEINTSKYSNAEILKNYFKKLKLET